MPVRAAPAKHVKVGASAIGTRSQASHVASQIAARTGRPGNYDFDARNLPTLDPKDFQWGTPSLAQQQQLYQQYMQMAFMHASPMHPMNSVPTWPMMVPACPVFPAAFHPSMFASCPPSGYLPLMTPVAAPVPAGSQQVTTPLAPKTPLPMAQKLCSDKEQATYMLTRRPSDASDDTGCYSACAVGGNGRPLSNANTPNTMATPTDTLSHVPPPANVQLSNDDLHLLFADDSFLLLPEDACSADDEGSLAASQTPQDCSLGVSLASQCLASSAGAPPCICVSEIDPCLFAADGDDDIDLSLDRVAASDFDSMFGLPQPTSCEDACMDEFTLPEAELPVLGLRIRTTAAGVHKPGRHAGGAACASAFATMASVLVADEEVGDNRQQVVPDRCLHPCTPPVNGGIRKMRSAAAAQRASRYTALSNTLSCIISNSNTTSSVAVNCCRPCEWDAGMPLDFDPLCLPMDPLE